MRDPKIQHLLDELDSILPPAFLHDPPLISIDGDALRVWTASDTKKPECYWIRCDEENGDVFKALETEGL